MTPNMLWRSTCTQKERERERERERLQHCNCQLSLGSNIVNHQFIWQREVNMKCTSLMEKTEGWKQVERVRSSKDPSQ